jgi:hypothetical protein
MIVLQFTKGSSILSRLICWTFRVPVSHFSIRLDNVVFHSNLLGAHVVLFKNFASKCKIVHVIDLYLTPEIENNLWDKLQPIEGRPYDFLGAIYLEWHGLMWRLFGKPMPETNPWASKDAYMCTEVLESLCFNIKNIDTYDPYRLYLSLTNRSK